MTNPQSKIQNPKSKRRGVVLLAVLIVVAILMLVGYQFHRLMSAELEAAQAANRVAQSRYLADSGLHYVSFVLSYPQTAGLSDGTDSNVPSLGAIYDNPEVFHQRPVTVGSGQRQGYFSIVAPRDLDDPLYLQQGFRFGVEDESGKINLNAILKLPQSNQQRVREMLTKLPDMTEELADSILNWIKPAASNSGENTDSIYYSSMGYAAKRGPLESLEELLLVRNITPRMLLGNDLNRNGRLEPEEDDSGGFLDHGMSRYLTIYSRERNVDATGQQRIWLNDTDLQGLHDKLTQAVGEEAANFIVGYRLYGQSTTSTIRFRVTSSGSGGEVQEVAFSGDGNLLAANTDTGAFVLEIRGYAQIGQQQPKEYGTLSKEVLGDLTQRPQTNVNSLFDLIGTPDRPAEFSRTVRQGRRDVTTYYRSPLQKENISVLRELLPLLFDKTSTKQEAELPARVNINTAPREVLMAIPNVSEDQVQHILDLRPGPDLDPSQAALYRTPAWLITEAQIDPQVLTAMEFETFFTTRSQVYRMQVVGYYELGGPVVRLEAVVDTNNGRPRFLYWRDITELGRGFDMGGMSQAP